MNINDVDITQSQLPSSYLNHEIFLEIKSLCESYESLSFCCSSLSQGGISAILGIDHIIFTSLKGTLASIGLVLKEGYINDGYAIVRKYYEGVILDIYKSTYLLEKYNPMESLYVEMVEKWCKGEKELPKFKNMIQYLQRIERLKDILKYYDITEAGFYGIVKERCNGNMHYNKLSYMLLNNPDYYVSNRNGHLNSILKSIMAIFELHWACLFVLHPEYMTSCNYANSLECGETPVENSQYWIASFAEDVFHKLWDKKIEVADYIKQKTELIFSSEIE